jgi:hypothetical protein
VTTQKASKSTVDLQGMDRTDFTNFHKTLFKVKTGIVKKQKRLEEARIKKEQEKAKQEFLENFKKKAMHQIASHLKLEKALDDQEKMKMQKIGEDKLGVVGEYLIQQKQAAEQMRTERLRSLG